MNLIPIVLENSKGGPQNGKYPEYLSITSLILYETLAAPDASISNLVVGVRAVDLRESIATGGGIRSSVVTIKAVLISFT